MKLIQPAAIERSNANLGFWTHPDFFEPANGNEYPAPGEFEAWAEAQGVEVYTLSLDADPSACDIQAAYEEGNADVSHWEPKPPRGTDGWFLVSIHDTEDGPYSVWLRRTQAVVQKLAPVGYLNTMTGHLWTPAEQPDAAEQSGLYEPLVLSREALAEVQQKDALQLTVNNIMNALGITGDGAISQLVLEKFIAIQAERDALAAENTNLIEAIRTHQSSTHFCEVCGKDDPCSTDDICYVLSRTPATDAAISALLAESLEACAVAAEAELAKGKVSADILDSGFNRGAEAMISMMRLSANALRAGRKYDR